LFPPERVKSYVLKRPSGILEAPGLEETIHPDGLVR
jgi:hypothetical protein